MRDWPALLLLAVSCAAPPAAPRAPLPPDPAALREEVLRTLASLERTFYVHWGAVEGTPEFKKLRADQVPLLREIADANGEGALMAYRVLLRLAPAEIFSETAKAILYTTAFGREENFLRWGLLSKAGLLPGVYGAEMLALKEAVVPFLRKALTDGRAARIQGGETEEREGRRRGDRVRDYAWVMLATILRRPFDYADGALYRDPQIRDFDLWLDRRR